MKNNNSINSTTDTDTASTDKNKQIKYKEKDLITSVSLLLAECKDALSYHKEALGYHKEALQLFQNVIEKEPYNAIAHAAIGLILLGTSNHNFAAMNACGLHQQEALAHLELALQLQPDIKMVQQAILFCQLEISEAKLWRNILSNNNNNHATTTGTSTSTNTNIATNDL